MHGHTWIVDINLTFELKEDYDGEILVDFGDMKDWINELDHKDLNEYFERQDVTAEFLAMYFTQRLKANVLALSCQERHASLTEIDLTVWESETSCSTLHERLQ